jgi:hypothetical protein
MESKRLFYDRHGVQEYYIYDPDFIGLFGHRRDNGKFVAIPEINGWVSPLLDVRFDMTGSELKLLGPDGQPFLTFQDLARERDQLAQQRDEALAERDAWCDRAEKMAEQLWSIGIEPSA